MKTQCLESLPPPHEKIRPQIARMLASQDFKATPQQVALLKYVVEQTLAGNSERIKAYTVATEVFGRRLDFDQNIDPIVSIQASRLRLAMSRYYQRDGKNDSLHIKIPKGSYVPVFGLRSQPPFSKDETEPQETLKTSWARRYWPTVLVRPVRNVGGDPDLDTWCAGLAAELAAELNRYPDIRIMTFDTDDQHTARFVIDGCVRSDCDFVKVILNLTDVRTGRQIWSHASRTEIGNGSMIAFQERVAQTVAVEVAGKRGRIAKTASREFNQNGGPPGSEAYEAVVRYYEYRASSTPEAFQRALTALEKAVAVDPQCGQVWAMRARLFAVIHALDIPGFDRPLEHARAFALKSLRLMPDDQRAHGIMAFIHLLCGDLAAGRMEVERALRLGPETLFILDGIAFMQTLMGDWKRGPVLIEKVIRLNPFYSTYVHYALWVNWIRQKNYERACQETMKFNRPADFWDHLAKAATLGLMGNIESGCKSAAALLKLKPDFPERGRTLIKHFIKFDDITDRIIKGLDAVGVQVQ